MRIEEKFKELKKINKKAFVVYIPFGFPNIETSQDILFTIEKVADIVEIGLPFSDPIADGPIIQEATTIALKNGATVKKLFSILKKTPLKIPILIMSYYNPIFRFGLKKFFLNMSKLGISGSLIVDLPIEESSDYIRETKKFNLETVFFITPTTSLDRAKIIVNFSKGFIYYISVTGITGPKELSYRTLEKHIRELKNITTLPVCVGFGIHNSEQIKKIWGFSDGVILGSCIVEFIKENYPKRDFLKRLENYLIKLKD